MGNGLLFKLIGKIYVHVIRRFILNPIMNLVYFIINLPSLKKGYNRMVDVRKRIWKLGEGAPPGVFHDLISDYRYEADPLFGALDFTPYPLVFFMRGLKDDCDGYATMVRWMYKHYGVTNKTRASVMYITTKPQKSLFEFAVNHAVFVVDGHVFSSGRLRIKLEFEYLKEVYGPGGGMAMLVNSALPKWLDNCQVTQLTAIMWKE